MAGSDSFSKTFEHLTGNKPFPWQKELYERFVSDDIPAIAAIPTGLGKTNVIAIWLIALAEKPDKIPRRLVYVVNRRTVVDQTTVEVEKIRHNLEESSKLQSLKERLGSLALSTLRGQFADNREWSADPSRPAVICGTVDMIGSRLLFSGYRIGFKSKPLHAGFLGQDALLVHDEAHLEPAFQKLVEKIQEEQHAGERVEDLPWPKLRVMALSATARGTLEEDSENVEGTILKLSGKDRKHRIVKKRIEATKNLVLHSIDDEKNLVEAIVEQAKIFADSGDAVLVFARTVEHVGKIVEGLTNKNKGGFAKDQIKTLTGTLRGLERDNLLVKAPVFQRFLPKSNRGANVTPAKDAVFLVCTSAGEVGVNISADHMVCDLSTFDSMAQRFGRVNRFGDYDDTEIHVVHLSSFGKTDKKGKVTISEFEERREKTLDLLKQLNGDASPAALEKLDEQDRRAAFSPEPTILPATDILFDAWSLTTIKGKMPGRPPVEPYLHGVSEWEPPQTQVAWREEVEIITGDLLESYPPQDLLEAYPLKAHELLRDRSDRVLARLRDLVKEPSSKIKSEKRKVALERVAKNRKSLVWIVGDRNEVEPVVLGDFLKQDNKRVQARIENRIVLLPPSVGGLSGGLFDGKNEFDSKHHPGYDISFRWLDEQGKWTNWCNEDDRPRRCRVWDDDENFDEKTVGMKEVFRIRLPGPEEDEDAQGRSWHWYVCPRSADDAGWSNAGPPITWQHHTDDVVKRAENIVNGLNWDDKFKELKAAIILAAKFHDLGKKREQWQRSIGNPSPTDWYAKPGNDPETGKRWKRKNCCPHYRHEFGSLLDVLDLGQPYLSEFKNLSDDMQELVLHLIAAHHGRARPHFPPEQSIDPEHPQSQADEQALETPRRFARLQRKYGRWGLAYLESLLRAADWTASAEPSEAKPTESKKTTKENRL